MKRAVFIIIFTILSFLIYPLLSIGQDNKLDYFYYLNEKLQQQKELLSSTNRDVGIWEKKWYDANNWDETEEQCKVILERDAYYSTTYPDGYNSTTYTRKASPQIRVGCKDYLQMKEQNRAVIGASLRQLYQNRAQIEQNIQMIMQALNE